MATKLHSNAEPYTAHIEAVDTLNTAWINKQKAVTTHPGVFLLPDSVSNNFVITRWTQSTGNHSINESLYINVGQILTGTNAAAYGGYAVDNLGRGILISANLDYVYSNATHTFNEGYLYYHPDTVEEGTPVAGYWDPYARAADADLSTTNGISPDPIDYPYARSSGNYKIPVNLGENKIYIKYLDVVSVDNAIRQTDATSGISYETVFEPGYYIRVENATNPVNNDQVGGVERYPDAASLAANHFIYIGSVTVTANTVDDDYTFTMNYTETEYGYTQGSTVGSLFATRTTSYQADGETYISFNEHLNAIGGGNVTANNPHGLTAGDIGITLNEALVTASTTITTNLDLSDVTLNPAGYSVIVIDASDNDVTLTLPYASTDTAGLRYHIKRVDQSIHNVIITTDYGELVPGTDSTIRQDKLEGGADPLEITYLQAVSLTVAKRATGSLYDWWIY